MFLPIFLLFLFSVPLSLSAHEGATFLDSALLASQSKKSDANPLRFVSRNISLRDKNYTPTDLILLTGSLYETGEKKLFLRKEAKLALDRLAKAYEKKWSTPLEIMSAYRSSAHQQDLWDKERCSRSYCAPAGHSEHQLGLAIDLWRGLETNWEDTIQAKKLLWMREYAHIYGWIESYRNGIDADLYSREPWHWRYVGVGLATRLHEMGLTFTEYMRLSKILSGWRKEKNE